MTLPVAQPAYILRGHGSQVHATAFIRSNSRLVTGDADGWIVVWNLAIKRAVAVWRAHEGSILGVKAWGEERIITHGKDNKLIVWKFSKEDELKLSTVHPVDNATEARKQPWLLHLLHVNTMNFCSFAQSMIPEKSDELLVAVPNTVSSESVDIFHLPTEKRIHTVPNPKSFKGGMIMAISIFQHSNTSNLTVISGYESGHTSVSCFNSSSKSWHTTYLSQPHLQPILSLHISPSPSPLPESYYYLTSSADAIIAKHPIPSDTTIDTVTTPSLPLKKLDTKHAGQQSLQIRNDGKIFATAGWDSKVRVYGVKNMKELAVLKWHKEGCYAVAFADVSLPSEVEEVAEEAGEGDQAVVKSQKSMTVAEQREQKAVNTHWLAVGSKDGKVSLWDIY